MKIKELSRFTGVNIETIRMYRNKGLLHPEQEDNGYYNYTADDLLTLLFIRKQRGSDIPLDTIKYTYSHPNPDEIISRYESEYSEIEEKIAYLRKQQEMLRMHIDHYVSFKETEFKVTRFRVSDDRVDLPLNVNKAEGEIVSWIADINMFIQGLHLPDDWYKHNPLPGSVQAQLTVGTYMPIIEKNGYTVPQNAVFTPKGEYLSCKVELERDGVIDIRQLMPLVKYAEENGLRLTNDSAAFIFRVDNSGKKTKYVFRLRVRVEAAD